MKSNNPASSLQNKYINILLEDCGLRTLCNLLTEEINNPIFILDKYRENLLYIDRNLRDEFDFYSYLNQKRLKRSEELEYKEGVKSKRIIFSWKNQDFTEVQIKLGNDTEHLGFLIIFEENPLQDNDYSAITQGAYALSLKLHQNYIVQNLTKRSSNELIDELLQGRNKNKKQLINSGELAGWDLTVPYQLFIIRPGYDNQSKQDKSGHGLYTYEMEDKIIHSLHRIIRTTLSRKYIIFSYNSDILLLIHYEKVKDRIKADIQNVYQQLVNKFNQIDISIGAGSFAYNCTLIADSYQQALYSLEFLSTTNEINRILFYNDLGILRLLWQIDCRYLMRFSDEFLSNLIEYDQKNNSNWVDALGVFLQQGCSIQYAAEQLHIHPNTMRYRIQRIQEILDIDLHDFETQLSLATAYKIHKFIICN